MPSVKCAKPQEWNSGAAIIVFSRAFSGIRDSSAAAGSSDLGWEREAPFGVPVVPEVRITALPRAAGGLRSERSPRAISVLDRRVGRVAVVPGDVALQLRVASASSSANSWS